MRKFDDFKIGVKLMVINTLVFVLLMVAIAIVVTKTERKQIVEELTNTIEGHNQGLVDMIAIANDVVVTDVKYDLSRLMYFHDSIFSYESDSSGYKWLFKGQDFEKDKEIVIEKFSKEFSEGVKHLAIYKGENGKFVCVNALNPEYIGKVREYSTEKQLEKIKNSNIFVYREKIEGIYREIGCKSIFWGDTLLGLLEIGRTEFSSVKVKKNFKDRNLLETGFTMLVQPDGKSKIRSSNCNIKSLADEPFFQEIVQSDSLTGIINTVYNDTAVSIFYSKLRMRYSSEITHFVVAIVKESEYLKPVYTTRNIIVFAIILGILIFILYSFAISKNINRGIYRLVDIINEISKGNINIKLNNNRKDEIGIMTQSVDTLIGGLNKTENFATSIGQGDFSSKYELLGEKDSLGLALIKMQENLADAKAKEKDRILADEKDRWSSAGLAKLGDILRKNANSIEDLALDFMRNLVSYLDVNQGALFIINDAEDKDEVAFDIKAAVAYDRERILESSVKMGEGLVGRCAFEQKTIYMTDVPSDYMKITSGMGEATASVLIIVPLVVDDVVIGVIELASFNEIETYKIEFIEKIAESIASTTVTITNNDRTKRLLSESIEQKEEMTAQEEELRQNLEEMQATQEDLARHSELNKQMQVELSEKEIFMETMMGSMSDFVFYKDLDGKYTKASESMLSIFRVAGVADIIGKSDTDFYDASLAAEFFNEEQEIIKTKEGFKNKSRSLSKTNGSEIEVLMTKMPLLNNEGECIGIFGVSKNITELK